MLDPYTGDASEMGVDRIERILRQRFGLIMAIQEAQNLVFSSVKTRTNAKKPSIKVERTLANTEKKGTVALEHVGPELIDFYPVDAFVNTVCPRIAIDDSVKYAKLLVTPFELEVAFGEKKWETGYQFDEIP